MDSQCEFNEERREDRREAQGVERRIAGCSFSHLLQSCSTFTMDLTAERTERAFSSTRHQGRERQSDESPVTLRSHGATRLMLISEQKAAVQLKVSDSRDRSRPVLPHESELNLQEICSGLRQKRRSAGRLRTSSFTCFKHTRPY